MVPLVLAHPSLCLWGLRQSPAPVPFPLLSEAGLGFGGGVYPPLGASLAWATVPGQDGPWAPRAPQPAFQPLPLAVWGLWPPPPQDWLVEVPPLWPTFPHGKQEAG